MDQFGPRKLSEIRDLLVVSGNFQKYVNQQTRNVVRIFKYGVSRELAQADMLVALQSLEPLQRLVGGILRNDWWVAPFAIPRWQPKDVCNIIRESTSR